MNNKKLTGINPNFNSFSREKPSSKELIEGILSGNRFMLSRAITIIESTNSEHRKMSSLIIDACLPHANKSVRIGITGTPGVGKSTFIETFGDILIKNGHKVAVLAIDPSSSMTGGSVLGDKTRMAKLSSNKDAFVRPTAAGTSLGGVSKNTREAIILCEAAGYDTIIIETVGVGQSETLVHSMIDFFLLLLIPGAGDELQGIKRGIIEMADLIAINKSDGEREKLSELSRIDYQNALHLFPEKESKQEVKAVTCSALTGTDMDKIYKFLEEYFEKVKASGYFDKRRNKQLEFWLDQTVRQSLYDDFYTDKTRLNLYNKIKNKVLEGKLSPFEGAKLIIKG